jgi:hypothetical protein
MHGPWRDDAVPASASLAKAAASNEAQFGRLRFIPEAWSESNDQDRRQ